MTCLRKTSALHVRRVLPERAAHLFRQRRIFFYELRLEILVHAQHVLIHQNLAVTARTGWGDPLYIRLNFGHPMMGSVSRGDRLHVHWQPQDAHVFTKT